MRKPMRKPLLIIGLLLIPSLLYSAGENITERIKTRVLSEVGTDSQIRQKVKEGSETDTTINQKLTAIWDEEFQKNIEDFTNFLATKNPAPAKYKYTQYNWKTVITVVGGSASLIDGQVKVDVKTDTTRKLFIDVK